MKNVFFNFLIYILIFNTSYSQTNNVIEITTIGSGLTIENAKFNALRSALEQVSGSYLSANSLVINDKLISDNITSITSGTIQTYEIIDQIEKGKLFYLTIKSIISPKSFAEFVSGKTGSIVIVNGGIYAANLKQINFNEEAELMAAKQLGNIYHDLLYNSIYYEVEAFSPMEEKISKNGEYKTFQKLPIIVTMRFTNSIDNANLYFKNNLKMISLSESKINNLNKINRKIYSLCIDNVVYYFQNEKSLIYLLRYSKGKWGCDYINSFIIDDGINKFQRYISEVNEYDLNEAFMSKLKFVNNLNNIKQIEHSNLRIKGFNSGYIDNSWDAYFDNLMVTNFKTFNSKSKYTQNSESTSSNIYPMRTSDNCILLWNSNAFWPIELNGYYTIEEIEKINEIKIIKNVSPGVNYTKLKTK